MTQTSSAWEQTFDIIDTFLSNEFEGGRHKVRVDMVMGFENNP